MSAERYLERADHLLAKLASRLRTDGVADAPQNAHRFGRLRARRDAAAALLVLDGTAREARTFAQELLADIQRFTPDAKSESGADVTADYLEVGRAYLVEGRKL